MDTELKSKLPRRVRKNKKKIKKTAGKKIVVEFFGSILQNKYSAELYSAIFTILYITTVKSKRNKFFTVPTIHNFKVKFNNLKYPYKIKKSKSRKNK